MQLFLPDNYDSALHFAKGSFVCITLSGMAWCSFRPIQATSRLRRTRAATIWSAPRHEEIRKAMDPECIWMWGWYLNVFDVYSKWLITGYLLILLSQWLNFGRNMPRPLWIQVNPVSQRQAVVVTSSVGSVWVSGPHMGLLLVGSLAAESCLLDSGDTDTRTTRTW